jgi:hypothetical protein
VFTRVKAKCLECRLHFVVRTLHPERHSAATLHCPECGHHRGRFLVWSEVSDAFIFQEVPGAARPFPAPPEVAARRPWWRFWR